VGPDFDPIASSAVIVGGRVTRWELIEGATKPDFKTASEPLTDPNYYGPYDPIRVHMVIERVYKGTASRSLEMVAGNTYSRGQWVGGAGACGAFDFDPTGKYWILGLSVDNFGRYRPGLPHVFFVGDDPPTKFDVPPRSWLAPLAPGYLPASGGPPVVRHDSRILPVGAAALVSTAFLLGASFVWHRRTTP
jgi:hypothetical protein